jgi:hypothetical protein
MRSFTTQATAVEGVRTFVPSCGLCGHDAHGGQFSCRQCPGACERIPEWRRRALEQTERVGRVAVVDMTGRMIVR